MTTTQDIRDKINQARTAANTMMDQPPAGIALQAAKAFDALSDAIDMCLPPEQLAAEQPAEATPPAADSLPAGNDALPGGQA